MARNVNINGLQDAINKELRLYADSVASEIGEIEKSVSNIAVKRLRVAGNFDNQRQGKNYRKGWRAKKNGKNGYIIYNATNYQLTHLLEYGHATKNGGRTRAFPHIRPVEEEVIKEFESKVRSALS